MAKWRFEQFTIFGLLFLCLLYNDPSFEARFITPSTELVFAAEALRTLFYIALLTFQILALSYLRVIEKKKDNPKWQEVTGKCNTYKKVIVAVVALGAFTALKTLLHLHF